MVKLNSNFIPCGGHTRHEQDFAFRYGQGYSGLCIVTLVFSRTATRPPHTEETGNKANNEKHIPPKHLSRFTSVTTRSRFATVYNKNTVKILEKVLSGLLIRALQKSVCSTINSRYTGHTRYRHLMSVIARVRDAIFPFVNGRCHF